MAATTKDADVEMAESPILDDPSGKVILLELPAGDTPIEDTVEGWIKQHPVVLIGRSWCPFCKDAIEFLSQRLGVDTYVFYADQVAQGNAVIAYVRDKTQHKTVPVIFALGEFQGGCDDVKAKREELEKMLVLHRRSASQDTVKSLDDAKLVRGPRSTARQPLFWFPNTVNNRVVRLTGVQVSLLSIVSAVFHQKLWGRYLAVFLLVDFGIRMTVGSFLSPLGMIATVATNPFEPVFKPGAPKQFASACGLFFALLGTVFYFLDFSHHDVVGAIIMAALAGAAGMEGFLNFCVGCVFFGMGIQLGLLPDDCYRIHTQTAAETEASYQYKMSSDKGPTPEVIVTDPNNAAAFKYKTKTDEWTKNDFDVIKHMQVGYFAMPLSLAGLAVALRLATATKVEDGYYAAVSVLSVVVFVLFGLLYLARLALYPHKCWIEWNHPLHSNSFGTITITLLLFSFLVWDNLDANNDMMARVLFWIGAVAHSFLAVHKFGEWVGRRLELEHVYTHWMMIPVGLAVAALVAAAVRPFALDNSNSEGNFYLARFFLSFAVLMWITLFVVTFFKTVTDHNSDTRTRHGVWIWVAAPCVIGLAESSIGGSGTGTFEQYYFLGLFLAMGLCYACLPGSNFFGQDPFNFGYWIECFAWDTIAACAANFYSLHDWRFSQNVMWITLSIAVLCNFAALMWVLVGVIQQRGVFTPEVKWGPLSFMKLTHEAIRENLATLAHYLNAANLDTAEGRQCVNLFAIHFQRFRILHEEHAKHEDEVIFKTFNDFYADHAKKWNDDHSEDHVKLDEWVTLANTLLDTSLALDERKTSLSQLQMKIPEWFHKFHEHLRGEEDHLNPVGRKIIPLALMKEMSRQVWAITPAERWEVIVPFIINNLPRHMQRVRYIKVLTWSMPERAQQIGAIVYRHTDAVMWETLVKEVPEIIPRGVPGWKRYY